MAAWQDDDLTRFIEDGYITVQTGLGADRHRQIRQQLEAVFAAEGNPGNEVLPRVPALWEVLNDRAVSGALEAILGADYLVHPHRHCHVNLPASQGQRLHQDSYEADENVRQHHPRWAMAFYYPQDVDLTMGPSAVVPGSHYYEDPDTALRVAEKPLCGPAGSVTIVHYELWHRAMANRSPDARYMVKFLFCRMREPAKRQETAVGATPQRHLQAWYGRSLAAEPLPGVEALAEALKQQDQAVRLKAAYGLAAHGRQGLPALMAAFRCEAAARLEENLDKNYTNPSQLDSGYGLAALGPLAVGPLEELLGAKNWWERAAAAAVLGDIGTAAAAADQRLAALTEDPETWVRRNAVEAVGTLQTGSAAAVDSLARRLLDEDVKVRHNAALALGRLGNKAQKAAPALGKALDDEDYFVRRHAALALQRVA